jgi:hypothetical protein
MELFYSNNFIVLVLMDGNNLSKKFEMIGIFFSVF